MAENTRKDAHHGLADHGLDHPFSDLEEPRAGDLAEVAELAVAERLDQLGRGVVVAEGVAGAVHGVDHVVAEAGAPTTILSGGHANRNPAISGSPVRLATQRHSGSASTSSTGAQMKAPHVS